MWALTLPRITSSGAAYWSDRTITRALPEPQTSAPRHLAPPTPVASGYSLTDIRQNIQTALQRYVDSVNREDFSTPPTLKDEGRQSSISYYRIGDLIFGVDDHPRLAGAADLRAQALGPAHA